MKKFAFVSSILLLIGVALAFLGVPVFADNMPPVDGLGDSAPMLFGTVSVFKTRTMLAALDTREGPTTFILRTFFKGQEDFDTEEVDIEIIKGKRRLAPFVSPVLEGKLVEDLGRVMKSFKPPYVKPKAVLTPKDLNTTDAGGTIYSGNKTKAQRMAEKVGRRLGELDDDITAREEWMACQAIDTGKVHVVGEGVDVEIDFQRDASHNITLVGTDLWSDQDNSDPGADFVNWGLLNSKDSGKVSGIGILGTDACAAFINHPKILGKLDNRRVEQGSINPKQLPEGVTFIGTYRDNGIDVDLYTYNSWYIDDAGVAQPYVPADKVWLGSDKAQNKKLYGMIQDFDSNFVGPRFPKSWEKKDPSVRYLMVQSAPLPALLEPDAFVSAKVV